MAQTSRDWLFHVVQTAAEMETALERILELMTNHAFTNKDCFCTRLALEEAVVNAIKHGHQGDTNKKVSIRYLVNAEHFLAEVEDEGPGFDPEALPDPADPENLERSCGRGVFLMRYYMTWVKYSDRGNCVTLCRQRTTS